MIPALQALTVVYGPLLLWAAGFMAWAMYMVRQSKAKQGAVTFVLDFLPYSSAVAATERELPEMRIR